jgi:acyl-CoA synthetase (NDP forming)
LKASAVTRIAIPVGLSVPALTGETRTALEGLVPPLASTRNPVDLTQQAYQNPQWLERFPQALDVIAADSGVGMTFFQLGPMARGDLEMARMVAAFRTRCAKPVVAAWPLMIEAARYSLHADGILARGADHGTAGELRGNEAKAVDGLLIIEQP